MPCDWSVKSEHFMALQVQKSMARIARNYRDPEGNLKCKVSDVFTGSSNVVYRLKFSDGETWALKIPLASHGKGSCPCWVFGELRFLIRSEALTMRMLRHKTSIPVPSVIDFGTGFDNDFGYPFILMEYVRGVVGHDFWERTNSASKADREAREVFLRSLSGYIDQLNRFEFDEMGYPHYDEEDHLCGLKPLSDYPLYQSSRNRPLACVDNDDSRNAILRMLARTLPSSVNDELEGAARFLRQVLHWTPVTPGETRDPRRPFVLAHPDLDLQNIIVDDDGHVKALIDWDRVRTVPRCVGNESYPLFLIEDWSYPYRSKQDFTDFEYCRDLWERCLIRDPKVSPEVMRNLVRNSLILLLFRSTGRGDLDVLREIATNLARQSLKGVSRLDWRGRGDSQIDLKELAGAFQKLSIKDEALFKQVARDRLTSGQWDILRDRFQRLISFPSSK
ncbi:kinase-like domain-containing protein [Echria macrotheca]|uniref:Kinase-like domain-containing protein n=1 Tax=Echria macrotheca TaxID=438768 RepID=A0AAJ0BJF0_9PEZI|nr:kinase-like domain-containing protein [Echria macrotheca]